MAATVEQLQKRFGIPGVVSFRLGEGGLPCVDIHTAQAEATVYLHGAHVTHYQPKGQSPVLFMSGKSMFEAGKPIRGGVPICFPWFGPKSGDPKAPGHGLVRQKDWVVEAATRQADGSVEVTLALTSDDAMLKDWPHEFTARFIVCVGAALELTLEITNRSAATCRYEEAMHTYLAVADVRTVGITGLGGTTYIDKVRSMERFAEGAAPIAIAGETDRVYLNTQAAVTVSDPAARRRITVSKEGSNTTVVWNPWIAKAGRMPDFGPDEWPRMLCIETCNAADNAVELEPGATHRTRAIIQSFSSQ